LEAIVSGSKGERVYLNEGGVMPELHLTGGEDSSGDLWYLDNGASNHMTRSGEIQGTWCGDHWKSEV
jgi:hypothetical protein